jgi:hypothetical protein
MLIAAGTSAVGGVIAWFTIRRVVPVHPIARGDLTMACEPACVKEQAAA